MGVIGLLGTSIVFTPPNVRVDRRRDPFNLRRTKFDAKHAPAAAANELLGDSPRGRAHGGSCSKMTEKQTIAIDVHDHEASEFIIIVP